jgi:hypothetical protein
LPGWIVVPFRHVSGAVVQSGLVLRTRQRRQDPVYLSLAFVEISAIAVGDLLWSIGFPRRP